jgi:hypothetical protein
MGIFWTLSLRLLAVTVTPKHIDPFSFRLNCNCFINFINLYFLHFKTDRAYLIVKQAAAGQVSG